MTAATPRPRLLTPGHLLLAVLALFLVLRPAWASLFNPAVDFAGGRNPNGVWQYGWKPAGQPASDAFQLYRNFYRVPVDSQVLGWSSGQAQQVTCNPTSSAIDLPYGRWEPGTLVLHPGGGQEYSVVRFVAPASGTYTLRAEFWPVDRATTLAVVVHNREVLFEARMPGTPGRANGRSFVPEAPLQLQAGDTLDFAVGASYFFGNTGLAVQIEQTSGTAGLLETVPPRASAASAVRLRVKGLMLPDAPVTLRLESLYAPTLTGTQAGRAHKGELFGTFNLLGAPAGPRDVVAVFQGGPTLRLKDGFEVAPAELGEEIRQVGQPDSAWALGWTPRDGGTFTAMKGPAGTLHNEAGFATWSREGKDWDTPFIAWRSANTEATAFGVWKPGEVGAHPSADADCVVRWTAPADGYYQVDAAFQPISEAGTDVYLLQGGHLLFTGQVSATRFEEITRTVLLKAGEVLDFGVSGGSWPTATTSLRAVVAPVAAPRPRIHPTVGAAGGEVTAEITGMDWPQAPVTVRLEHGRQRPIVGQNSRVTASGKIVTTFDLRGPFLADPGLPVPVQERTVVVQFTGGPTLRLEIPFTIELQTRPLRLWASVTGRPAVLQGRPTTYTVSFGNGGWADVAGASLFINLPKNAEYELRGVEIEPPVQPDGVTEPIDWSEAPMHVDQEDRRVIPLFLHFLPAGSTRSFQLRVTLKDPVRAEISAWISRPILDPGVGIQRGRTQQIMPANKARDCIIAIGTQVIERVLRQLIPYECTAKATAFVLNLYGERWAREKLGDPNYYKISNWGQFLHGFFGVVRACAPHLIPAGWSYKFALAFLDTVALLDRLYNDGSACWEAFGPVYKTHPTPVQTVNSFDPNDKVGPAGVGQERWTASEAPLRYTIFFENLATASAPAHEVLVRDQLPKELLDLDTLTLGPVSFGEWSFAPPPGLSEWTTTVSLRPGKDLLVRIEARLDRTTGVLTWKFTSLDPATGELPEDPFAGFLPPNKNPPEGDGSVFFTVMPKAGLPTGTVIRNQARIFFDTNAPIDTPIWSNTVDNTRPVSRVASLTPTAVPGEYQVLFDGQDDASGIGGYTLYVSENGGPFEARVFASAEGSERFRAELGKRYAFYSEARDGAGNVEKKTPRAEAGFSLQVTVEMLIDAVRQARASGHIRGTRTETALLRTLDRARAALRRRQVTQVAAALRRFRGQVREARGRTITRGAAAALDRMAQAAAATLQVRR